MSAPIEGEVITMPRRIERNAGRTPAILPPSKDEKLRALERMDPQRQVEHVTEILVHSHAGLLLAIAAQDLPGIVEAKQQAATIAEIVKQKRMGKEMQDHAAEFVRRVERGLGVAIREGQANGTVAKRGEIGGIPPGAESRRSTVVHLAKPSDFAAKHELQGRGQDPNSGIYAMTDGVSDEQFNEALAEARSEGNLSRTNVARKCKAKVAIDADDPLIDAEVEPQAKPQPAQPKRRLTKHDSTEMLANINGMLNGIVESLPFIDPSEIDPEDPENQRVIENARQSMNRIRRLLKDIENG